MPTFMLDCLKGLRAPFCKRYSRSACNGDHVLQYRWEYWNLKIDEKRLRFLVPFAILAFIKASPSTCRLHCTENSKHIYFLKWNCAACFQFLYLCIWEQFIYSHNRSSSDWCGNCINHSQIHESRNWETEHYNSVFGNNEAVQFHFLEYITRNQTFILDSHRPFICSLV